MAGKRATQQTRAQTPWHTERDMGKPSKRIAGKALHLFDLRTEVAQSKDAKANGHELTVKSIDRTDPCHSAPMHALAARFRRCTAG